MSADKELPVVAWRYTDARGHYRYRGPSDTFGNGYAILKPFALADHARASARIAELERENAELASQLVVQHAHGATIAGLKQQLEQARKALADIAAIEDKMFGGDWDEIEQARAIARAAIASRGTAQEVGK
jgi:hypothetical protein